MAEMGTIQLFAWTRKSDRLNWAVCDGRLLKTQEHAALFSLLGNTYGGDGRTTFALPKESHLPPIPPGGIAKYYICIIGNYPQGPY